MAWIATYRWPLVAALLLIGAALAVGIATFRPDWLPSRVAQVANGAGDRIGQQAGQAASTVAGLFALRSPGQRVAGALASLKNKRHPLLHERALPKIRRPLSPLAAIVAAPPVLPVVPPEAGTPLFNVVAPKPVVPIAQTVPPGGAPGGFPGITGFPGGGGGVIVGPPAITPPPITPPVTPEVPGTPTPPVPEPATWAMMLMGFAMIA